MLEPRTFDWLCEQGHVGLERVAKARRDPALVEPVKAALPVLAAIYARLKGDVSVLHAARENLLLPVDLVHVATGAQRVAFARTRVTMRALTAAEVDAYVASGEPFGKAGGYAIQETADRFVTRLDRKSTRLNSSH